MNDPKQEGIHLLVSEMTGAIQSMCDSLWGYANYIEIDPQGAAESLRKVAEIGRDACARLQFVGKRPTGIEKGTLADVLYIKEPPKADVQARCPTRLVHEQNAREHWRRKASRAKSERHDGFICAADAARKHPKHLRLPIRVTITRLSPRKLDSDGLVASAKHFRDGVADYLDLDDGKDSLVSWAYEWEKTSANLAGTAVRIQET